MFSFSIFSPAVFADVIMPGTHPLDRCVKITNLDQFPDIVLIGYVTGPMIDNYEIYLIKQGECLTKGYKFNHFSVYAVPKGIIPAGGVESLAMNETKKASEQFSTSSGDSVYTLEYTFADSQVKLLSDSIEPYGGTVPDSDSRRSETIEYMLAQKPDGSYALVKITGTPAGRTFFESLFCSILSFFGGAC